VKVLVAQLQRPIAVSAIKPEDLMREEIRCENERKLQDVRRLLK
jgi:hypothetical protein